MLPAALIDRYHGDSESVYRTWFLDEGRLKAFRTIRRGIQTLVRDLRSGTFAPPLGNLLYFLHPTLFPPFLPAIAGRSAPDDRPECQPPVQGPGRHRRPLL